MQRIRPAGSQGTHSGDAPLYRLDEEALDAQRPDFVPEEQCRRIHPTQSYGHMSGVRTGVLCVSAYIEELSETCRLLLSFGQLPRGLAVGGHVLGIDLEEESLEYGQ